MGGEPEAFYHGIIRLFIFIYTLLYIYIYLVQWIYGNHILLQLLSTLEEGSIERRKVNNKSKHGASDHLVRTNITQDNVSISSTNTTHTHNTIHAHTHESYVLATFLHISGGGTQFEILFGIHISTLPIY